MTPPPLHSPTPLMLIKSFNKLKSTYIILSAKNKLSHKYRKEKFLEILNFIPSLQFYAVHLNKF